MKQNFQKETLVWCGKYKFEITMGISCSSKVLSTTHFPPSEKMTLCGSKQVWALESPVMSVEEIVKVDTISSVIIVLVLPYPPMSLLQKAPPWQFSELLWVPHMFRNLTATADNVEAEKCLNLLKPNKCLQGGTDPYPKIRKLIIANLQASR